MEFYNPELDFARIFQLSDEYLNGYRPPYTRDISRLIHCPSFRRLQGKTQLFPGLESDFFRNRLTHSLEVAQIAKTICLRLNNKYEIYINPEIAEFAGLAHDLGHPPFGHQGEEALNEKVRDFGGFEGNAQTLRLLCKIEKKHFDSDFPIGIDPEKNDIRRGLNLTFRSLASIFKYDNMIPLESIADRPIKGYYASEEEIVSEIKRNVCHGNPYEEGKFKTIECSIMDVADDIAYSVYDLEDCFKAGFLTPLDMLAAEDKVYRNVSKKVKDSIKKNFPAESLVKDSEEIDVKSIIYQIFESEGIFGKEGLTNFPDEEISIAQFFHNVSKKTALDGFLRTAFTSQLINKFVNGVEFEINEHAPSLSKVYFNKEILIQVETLKHFNYESQILSPKLKIVERRGKEIVDVIFDALNRNRGYEFLPPDYKALYKEVRDNEPDRKRVICDFIAGMTDRYAIEFYGRLTSEKPETIFKPF